MTIEELKAREGDKSLVQLIILRAMIGETGLPRFNYVLAKHNYMVSWNKDTGEVKTIEYETRSQSYYVDDDWYY